MTKPSPLIVDEDLARHTTQRLVGKLEAVALVVQATGLTTTATIDKLMPGGQQLLYGLAVVHIALAIVVLRVGGPFRWGAGWAGVWLGLVFVMPLIMAHLVAPTQYGSSPACVPLCGYANGPFLIMAFYPWIHPRFTSIRPVLEVTLIVALGVEQFLLVHTLQGQLTSTNVTSVLSGLLGNTTAFLVGKAVGSMCRRAARAQLEQQHENYEEFFNFLHSHVKGSILAIKKKGVSADSALSQLRYLDEVVTTRRLQMMGFTGNVPLAAIFKEHIRRFEGSVGRAPQIGALSVDRTAAQLIDRALGDLLSNAVHHGSRVDIDFTRHDGLLRLQVSDDGPGLPDDVLDDPSTSLFRLRRDARSVGGDLTAQQAAQPGACLVFSVPIRIPRRRRSGVT